ncbi:MAG: (2Fe-2S)-binding protein [Bacillota bacterium]|nr:(2Fe-2S)-binding protein [Bacillota bacterium]
MKINFEVNGISYCEDIKPNKTLVKLLRNRIGLTGTKEACSSGDCGACTVLVNGKAVNSCLYMAAEVDGKSVLTVEGLSIEGHLNPLQEAFIDEGAVQCGFCTPGMLMSAEALLRGNPNPTTEQIREGMVGNICRCTGYEQIVRAIKTAAGKMQKSSRSEGEV